MSDADDKARVTAATRRYLAAGHAIQSGVAAQHAQGSPDGSSKHLRVGLNLRAVDQAGLVRLLISKGIITEVEYHEALADSAEREVVDMESFLGVKLR